MAKFSPKWYREESATLFNCLQTFPTIFPAASIRFLGLYAFI